MKDEDKDLKESFDIAQNDFTESSSDTTQDDSPGSSIDKTQDNSGELDLTFVESTEDGEELPTKDVNKKLREELKTCRKEKEEYLTGWQRAKADYINLQKELEHARVSSGVHTKEKMIKELLPVLDSFDMAFANKEHWEKIDKDWQDGITSIYQQLLSGLSKSGVEKIDQADVPFDTYIHQSISIIETDDQSKDHTVSNVLQFGYKIHDPSNSSGQVRVIRPAKVSIYEFKNPS
jgi:molecular chaperone GrpE